jgi:D-alanyl-D-alanine carboxypeptidase/D-alanyl-D-alanine-endopeptidase (penicillin-binding protein 4)
MDGSRHTSPRAISDEGGRHGAFVAAAMVVALLSLVLAGKAASAEPVPPSVQATIDEVQSKPLYTNSFWGLQVIDQQTGEVLIDQLPGKLFVPGSIMKTFTTSAALANYGPDYRFRTPVYRTGGVRDGRLDGDLVLVGSGDYSFGLREQPNGQLGFNSTPAIDHNYGNTGLPGPTILANSHPKAGVEDLAQQVRRAGIRRIEGNVIIDDRLFQDFEAPDGLITPIWFNENVIDMQATPTAPGEPANLRWRPKTPAIRVVNKVKTGPAGSVSTLTPEGPEHGVVTLRGRIAADSPPLLSIVEVPHPTAFARTAFIQALRKEGVKVSAPRTGANPQSDLPSQNSLKPRKRVALRVSDPLSEYIEVILKVSYNRGADLMLCLLAVHAGSKDCADGLTVIQSLDANLGVDPDSKFQFDGAGSDDRSRLSTGAATTFLRNLTGQPYWSGIFDGMPILGVDGTLRQEGLGFPAAGFIHAKTGNRVAAGGSSVILEGGQTRIGYIQAASGRTLVYADMIGNIVLGSTSTEAAQGIFDVNIDMTTIESAIQQGY